VIQAVDSSDDLQPHRRFSPVVRPYALVRGRTRPTGERLDVISMAYSLRVSVPEPADLEPEHLALLRRCAIPMSVAELASALDLPLGVVRVLLADLRERELVRIDRPSQERVTDIRLLREVADGLRRL
jgi:DNA-binding transcriptional ArsR family regulator